MSKVDSNRLKGNKGAAIVAERLSGKCLVRPVAADTDVGIDLYCETIEEDKPFLHFWVQVKSGNQCRVLSNTSIAAYSFTFDELRYWLRQPVPVYAALVPLSGTPPNRDIFIVDITHQFLYNRGSKPGKSIALQSDIFWPDNDEMAIDSFINTTVPIDVALLSLRDGVLSTIPTLKKNYIHLLPENLPVLRFVDEILEQLRRTASFSLLSPQVYNEPSSAPFRKRLVDVLAAFEDDAHWETSAASAIHWHLEGEFERSARCYDRAVACICNDQNVNQDPQWIKNAEIFKELAKFAREGRGWMEVCKKIDGNN